MGSHRRPFSVVPWNHWYHTCGSTYGTWLPGDPRGWRTRDHRFHVDGDYQSPPPDTAWQRELHRRNAQRLKKPPVYLESIEARRVACDAVVEKLLRDRIECAAAAVGASHFHALIRVPDHQPRTWLGRAKTHATHALNREKIVDGRAWAQNAQCKPIENAAHFERALPYVANHAAREGAAVWVHDAFARLIDRC